MKTSCLLTRREGTTRQAFREYYETAHAPLAVKYFPFRKYLRNHVVEASGDIDFDVVMECYIDDQINVSGVNAGEVHAIMDADEKRFMNQRMIRYERVDERVLSGPAIGVTAPGTRRQMLLLGAADPTAPVLAAKLNAWSADLAALPGIARVSLDTVRQQVSNDVQFPYAAIISLWFAEPDARIIGLTAPAGVKLEVTILVDVCETKPADLTAQYAL